MQSSNTIEPITPDAPSETPAAVTPLLPAFFLMPAALFWLVALPMGILLLLNFQGYQLIEGNMDSAQQSAAHYMGAFNVGLFLTGLLGWVLNRFTLPRSSNPAELHLGWAIASILLATSYLWFAVTSMDDILPRNVRSWLYPEDRFLYNQFAFAMLPLFWGILRLAGGRPAARFKNAISWSTGVALGTPILLYLTFNALTYAHLSSFAVVIVASAVVVAGIVLFIALSRIVLLVVRRVQTWGASTERIIILLIAWVLPIGGLILNRRIPFPTDFQSWEVYALVMVNGGILLLASFKHAQWPRGSLYLLSATLPFSLYFFLVFLPFAPLSIIAVLALGAGFLVFTPVFLFVLHLSLINQARRTLAKRGESNRVWMGCVLSMLLLPGFFTARGLADRAALHAALDYVYAPSIETQQNVYSSSRLNLRRALANHRHYKSGISYPLLSPFYSWLVFDNLMLPDEKMTALEKTFFGESELKANGDLTGESSNGFRRSSVRDRNRMPRARNVSRTVSLQHLDVGVTSASEGLATMTLTFNLENTGIPPAEYVQTLPLPAGIQVSGFRLHIDGHAVPGRITEKKTALWVYSMIRDSERRDPGLLYYSGSDELELRVFPVVHEKPSVVEIDFLVPAGVAALQAAQAMTDPVEALRQAGELIQPTLAVTQGAVVLAGASPQADLPAVPRETYLHLIVDRSANAAFHGSLGDVITVFKKTFPDAKRARVTLANYEIADVVDELVPLSELANWNAAEINRHLGESGGFSLDRAVANAIRQHRDHELNRPTSNKSLPPQPIFVVLGDSSELQSAPLEFTRQWSALLPQLSIYQLNSSGVLKLVVGPDGVMATPLVRLGEVIRPVTPNGLVTFSSTTGGNNIEYFDPGLDRWTSLGKCAIHTNDKWSRAIDLQLKQIDQARSPGDAAHDLKELVKASRDTGILIPATSYIVVENSAQWRMLELSERQKLGQNSALAFREAPSPSALALVFGFAGYLGVRRWRTRRLI